jgi:gamma-glutamyltranspeptidase/glutathione hydrolase
MIPRREPPDTELLEPGRGERVQPQRVAFSRHGMVSTAHYLATEAAVGALRDGGNAIDAAVAAAFALGVCEPQASGLGGQTMMLVHTAEPRRTFALDGSSRAPNRATPEEVNRKRRRGYRAATVPSTPAVLGYALRRYGKLPLDRVLAPSIALAENGFPLSELQRALMRRERRHLRARNAATIFLRDGRRVPPVGASIRQPVLAGTLRRLAEAGVEDFYTGDIGRLIHEDMVRNDGLIRDDDLAQIPWPIERRPLATRFQGMRVVTFPPPGAGRALLEMLHIVEQLPERNWVPDRPESAVALAEVIRRAALDRRDRPYDPNFYPQIPDKAMLSRDYARKQADRIRRRSRRRGETTHLSVMDRAGNVVALTQSIEQVFGACVATPELGFLYNNYMLAFEYEDIAHPYSMRPNAAPWASVAPTIVFRGPRPWLAIGSPGSERIISAIMQVFLRLLTHRPFEAVAAPRLHCSVDGRVSLEASRFRDDIPQALEKHGFTIDRRDAYSFYLGCVQLVLRERRGFVGVADPRRDGSAGGVSA